MKSVTRFIVALAILTTVVFAGLRNATAQETGQSTWKRVNETKIIRLAGTNSDFWAFKDTSGSTAPGAVKIGDTVWRGVGPVIAKQIADALGAKLEIVDSTWGSVVAGLQAGQFDLVFGLDGTPQRAAAIDFIPQSLFWYGTALTGLPGVDIGTWAAIDKNKLRVGVPSGTSMELEVTKRAPNAQISKFQNFNEMIAAYQAGRIDALTGSLTSATIMSARLKGSQVKMPTPAALYPAGAAVRQETDQRWRNFLTTALQYYVSSGAVQAAMNDVYAFRGVDVTKVQPVVQH